MEINNPEDVASTLRQAQQPARNDITRDQIDTKGDEDQNRTSDTKTPNEPKEKLTGIFFWMIFFANCIKDFIDLILIATVYLSFLTMFTTMVVVPPTFLYLHANGIDTKKKVYGLLADLVMEFVTFGAAPGTSILLILYKIGAKYEYGIEKKKYEEELAKSQK